MMARRLMTSLYGLTILFATSAPVLAAETLIEKVDDAESPAYGPFYSTADFWVAIGFLVFVVAVSRPAWRFISTALDSKAVAIKSELDEAQRLREEAQHTLAEYQRKQRDTLAEAEAIVAEARAEAERMQKTTLERTEATLERREQQALDMIAAAEIRAVAEVRALAADLAIDATRRLLTDIVEGQKGDELINEAISEIPSKLN